MIQFLLLSVAVIITIPTAITEEISPVVESKSGPVRGKIFKTLYDQRSYYAFKGIPYAEAPVNKLRFKVCYQLNLCLLFVSLEFYKHSNFENFEKISFGKSIGES